MDDIDRTQDSPQSDVASGVPATATSGDQRYFPYWLRERLIAQFQGIDHFTRSEAVGEVEAYERNFLAIFGEASDGGPANTSLSPATSVPPPR